MSARLDARRRLLELVEQWRSEADDREKGVCQLRHNRQDLPADFFNYRLDEARILRRVADSVAALLVEGAAGREEPDQVEVDHVHRAGKACPPSPDPKEKLT